MCFSVGVTGPVCGTSPGRAMGLPPWLWTNNLAALAGLCFFYLGVSHPSQPSSSPLRGGGLGNGYCYL